MEGVTRAYFLDKHEEAMRQIVENTAEGLGMKAVLKYAHVVHPVINDDDDLTEIAQKAVVKLFGEETLCHMPAMMGSEDFANYAAEIPAVFGFIGCPGRGQRHDLQQPPRKVYGQRVSASQGNRADGAVCRGLSGRQRVTKGKQQGGGTLSEWTRSPPKDGERI